MLFETQIIKAAASDANAFSKLYQKYINPSYAFIAFRVKNRADAEDLSSELWMKVLNQLPSLKSHKPEVFRAWLFTMARNLVVDFYRKNKMTLPLNEDVGIPSEEENKKTFFEDALIKKLVQNLPQQQAEIISLKYFSSLRNKEIAKLMRISEKTVASHLVRAHEKLRKGLRKLAE